MMDPAHSNGSAGGFPTSGTLARLQATLGCYVRGSGSGAEEAEVCLALDELAREAHERKLHGEQMLLAFKGVWRELPEVDAVADRREQQRLLGRLVTLCIDVYYRRR